MQRHPQLVPDPEQEQAPLRAVDGALADQLVEALGVQLAPDLADASLTGLALLKLLVQLFLKEKKGRDSFVLTDQMSVVPSCRMIGLNLK